MSRWWMISDEDAKTVRRALVELTSLVDEVRLQKMAADALYRLDSGLNETKRVPDDFCVCEECQLPLEDREYQDDEPLMCNPCLYKTGKL